MEEEKKQIDLDKPVKKSWLSIDEKNWLNNLPFLLFVAMLGVLHVANSHMAESKVRQINLLEKEIKELRWMYMTSKSELMYKSKQSEVAKMVEELGLYELKQAPYIIKIDEDGK